MQTCPSCQHPLPTSGVFFYCPNCPQQVRCKSCHEELLPGAQRCVMCGTPIGESGVGQSSSDANPGGNLTPAMNKLKFIENSRGRSLDVEVVLTNEVGISWGGTAIAAIVSGHIVPGKPSTPRAGIRDLNTNSPQQLSLLNYESSIQQPGTTIDAIAQLPGASNNDADKLKHIFRHNGEQLQLMETRLKAANRLDAARRLIYLVLLYSRDVDGREEIPRTDLNDILRRVGLYDNNTATWIGKSADLIVERDMVGLRLSGQEEARRVLAEVLDRSVEDKWSLTSGAASRSTKSNSKGDPDSENSTKSGKRKTNGFSKDVESWVASWKQLGSNIDAHSAIKDCSVTKKGCFGLWAIGKVTSNPDVAVSSYKLKQFLYLGLGIKVDERHLERSLQSISGQGSLIKVQHGFQLLAPGWAEVEKLLGFMQETAANDSLNNSDEV
jgi:predicted RNA-binding Zn-ribbon protein involved in translation (DUF1610 family)